MQECNLKDSDWAADSRHTDLVEPVMCCHYTLRHRAAVFLTIHRQTQAVSSKRGLYSYRVSSSRWKLSFFLSNFSSLCWLVVVLVVWQTTALMQFRKTHPCQAHKCTGNDYTKHNNTLLCVCVSACVFSLFPAGMDINLFSTKENNYHSCTRKEGALWAKRETYREIERQRVGWWAPDCHFLK